MADPTQEDRGDSVVPGGVAVPEHDEPAALWSGHRLRIGLLVFSVFGLAALLSTHAVREALDEALNIAGPLLAGHPFIGPVLFVLLSALSSLLVFFSSAVLVPVAVYAWGDLATIFLLWCGWLLGGTATYAIGRMFNKPLLPTRRFASVTATYLDRMPARLSWPLVFLMQLALPSEVPGYLCGFLRVRFRVYATAVAVAEIPYAAGMVLLGESVVHARPGWLIALGLAAAVLLGGAMFMLRMRLRSEIPAPHPSVPVEDIP
ncbi:TVP38/TMEM64 family protein [Pseudoxanthomonas sacheonensis]|uniref:TVP38/TMEM64 family protein n=1 Tax=Pseudoxanthomonas sacheonensis TaxID=443615 RepID=UPI0013D62145|nr:VTT domain-containing protein [Pseudoxanthomonas sacheonensis]